MIITARNGSLFMVDQNEHGRLAGELCERWGNDDFAVPHPERGTRLAASMHDDGWRASDDAVRFNAKAGRPMHFLEIDLPDHVDLYRRGVEHALAADPYAGLLVSMHWTGLYRSRWGVQRSGVWGDQDPAVSALLNDSSTARSSAGSRSSATSPPTCGAATSRSSCGTTTSCSRRTTCCRCTSARRCSNPPAPTTRRSR